MGERALGRSVNDDRKKSEGGTTDTRRDQSTIRPPFDPEAFAREADSSVTLETVPPPSGRPTLPPPPEYAPEIASGTMQAMPAVDSGTVPCLAVAREDLEWFGLSPVALSLVRHVDGVASLATICEAAGMRMAEVARIFEDLERDGLVVWA
jgi:hypothetical protein